MSAEEANTSLLERIQRPEVSKETAKKIALIEEEFVRAEVEQCMFLVSFLFFSFCFGYFVHWAWGWDGMEWINLTMVLYSAPVYFAPSSPFRKAQPGHC